jgi:hypothetical protein
LKELRAKPLPSWKDVIESGNISKILLRTLQFCMVLPNFCKDLDNFLREMLFFIYYSTALLEETSDDKQLEDKTGQHTNIHPEEYDDLENSNGQDTSDVSGANGTNDSEKVIVETLTGNVTNLTR